MPFGVLEQFRQVLLFSLGQQAVFFRTRVDDVLFSSKAQASRLKQRRRCRYVSDRALMAMNPTG